MKNLLIETLEELAGNDKNEADVKWVGSYTHKTTWEDFKKIADVDYDCGLGPTNVARDLSLCL